jgi:hypothetical protein
MISSIILVLLLGQATRGSKRWIELPFSHSSLGARQGVADRGPGRVRDRSWPPVTSASTRRGSSDGVRAGGDRFHAARPGTAVTYVVITLAILFVAGVVDALRAARRAAGRRRFGVLVIAPAIGTRCRRATSRSD